MAAEIVLALILVGGAAAGQAAEATHGAAGVTPVLSAQVAAAPRAGGGPAVEPQASGFRLDFSTKRAGEMRSETGSRLTVSGKDPASRATVCASRQLPADASIDPGIVAPAREGLDEGMLRAPDCLLR